MFFFRGGSFTNERPDSSRPPSASSSRSDLVYSGRQQKSWNFDGYSSDNDVMQHFSSVFFFLFFFTILSSLFNMITHNFIPSFLFKFRPKSILTELGPLNYKEVVHGTAPHWKAEVKRTGTKDKVRKPCLTSDNDNVTLRDLQNHPTVNNMTPILSDLEHSSRMKSHVTFFFFLAVPPIASPKEPFPTKSHNKRYDVFLKHLIAGRRTPERRFARFNSGDESDST